MRLSLLGLICLLCLPALACAAAPSASPHTQKAQAQVRASLDLADPDDFVDAWRGFLAPLPDKGVIPSAKGTPAWDLTKFAFLQGITPAEYLAIREQAQGDEAHIRAALRQRLEAIFNAPDFPATVNPSLWRQSQLCYINGLFEVVPDGIYQVRNADLSNLTIFEGPQGLVVADPLISAETAHAALKLYYRVRHKIPEENFDAAVAAFTRKNPTKAVRAVIFSHSHVDHYGGVLGITKAQYTGGKNPHLVAPTGFMEAAVSENVLAGTAMNRRAVYMYGRTLPRSPAGNVGTGLGLTTSSGQSALVAPTLLVTETGQKISLGGLEFVFLLAPDTEAPAEMHWYIEKFKAVTAAENCCRTLHNTYTLRGAKTRDPLSWARYLDETLRLWGDRAEVIYGMHHWPAWNAPGKNRVRETLSMGRDGYRFINDQTLRLANAGLTPDDIAESLQFPEAMQKHWAMRGYYGTLSHNVKATFALYLGWYDGNPANLHLLPRKEAAGHYVQLMGGAQRVVQQAQKALKQGYYRWAAELSNHVLWFRLHGDAKAQNLTPEEKREHREAVRHYRAAQEVQAEAFRQMGYQAESGPWRNNYLSGAQELLLGIPAPLKAAARPVVGRTEMRAMSMDMLFDYMGIHVNPDVNAPGVRRADFVLPGKEGTWRAEISHSALNGWALTKKDTAPAQAQCRLDKESLISLLLGETSLDKAVAEGKVSFTGSRALLEELLLLGRPLPMWFDLVAPPL